MKHQEQCNYCTNRAWKPRWSSYDADLITISLLTSKKSIMKTTDSYAQERINFYEERFKSETNNQLANDFSALAATRGWTSERSYYSHALINELKQRGIDISAICKIEDERTVIINLKVVYNKATHSLLPESEIQ